MTIVNLTATWTGPSRVELPVLQKLYDSYRNSGLDVVMLIVDDSDSVQMIEEFAKQLKLSIRVGILPQTLSDHAFRISQFIGIPQSLVIEDGAIVLITRGAGKAETGKLRSFVETKLR